MLADDVLGSLHPMETYRIYVQARLGTSESWEIDVLNLY